MYLVCDLDHRRIVSGVRSTAYEFERISRDEGQQDKIEPQR
jgi:hypothetical protein